MKYVLKLKQFEVQNNHMVSIAVAKISVLQWIWIDICISVYRYLLFGCDHQVLFFLNGTFSHIFYYILFLRAPVLIFTHRLGSRF